VYSDNKINYAKTENGERISIPMEAMGKNGLL
jgi:hypothetical protein